MTNRGRICIILWTMFGLQLVVIIAGNLSSSLSAGSIHAMNHQYPDEEVIYTL